MSSSSSKQEDKKESVRFSPNPFYSLFYKTPARTLCPKDRKLISIDASTPVSAVIDLLHKHKILAAPVFDKDNQCMGSVDVLSVFKYMINNNHTNTHNHQHNTTASISAAWAAISALPVSTIVNSSHCAKLVPFFQDNPMSMLVDLFGTGVHRVALFMKDKQLLSTVSQSDCVRWVAVKIDEAVEHSHDQSAPHHTQSVAIATAVGKSGDELSLFSLTDTVSSSSTMFDGILALAQGGRRALAVVDDDGRLVCDLCTTHLHHLPSLDHPDLQLSIVAWMKKCYPQALQPAAVKPSASYGDIVRLLALKKVHRLWVLDADGKPNYVVSSTDVLRVLSSGDAIDMRMASGDTDVKALWREDPHIRLF